MPKRGPGKYEPLRAFLAAQPPDTSEVTLTVAEVEALLGSPLPPSARTRQFWGNTGSHWGSTTQGWAWRRAGWRVRWAAPGRWVTFARAPPAGPP